MADITIKDLAAGTPSALDLLIFANPTTGVAKKTTIEAFKTAFSIPNTSNPEPGFYPFLSSTEANTFESSGLKQIDGNFRIVLSDRGNYSEYESSLFTLDSITNGFLKPRMTTVQRTSIASPATGLEVFDITLNLPYYYNGSAWATAISGITTLNTLTALTQTFAVGSAGTDFAISSATSTHTFNIPTASATARGLLSSANWTTFNSKVGGSGTTNYLAKFTAAGTIGNSIIFDNGTAVGIGTNSLSTYALTVAGTIRQLGSNLYMYNSAGTFFDFQMETTNGSAAFTCSGGNLSFRSGGLYNQNMTLLNNGSLLLGTVVNVGSSKFTIESTTFGTIPLPRMTTAQIKAITSPVNGLMAYSTDDFTPCFYDSNTSRWEKLNHSIL